VPEVPAASPTAEFLEGHTSGIAESKSGWRLLDDFAQIADWVWPAVETVSEGFANDPFVSQEAYGRRIAKTGVYGVKGLSLGVDFFQVWRAESEGKRAEAVLNATDAIVGLSSPTILKYLGPTTGPRGLQATLLEYSFKGGVLGGGWFDKFYGNLSGSFVGSDWKWVPGSMGSDWHYVLYGYDEDMRLITPPLFEEPPSWVKDLPEGICVEFYGCS